MKKTSAQFQLPLTNKEASRLYWELSRRGAYCNGENYFWKHDHLSQEEFFTLAFLQSRYDPRLMAILIDFFSSHEVDLNPITFKKCLQKDEAISIAAVIGEFVREQKSSDLFQFLISCAKPVPTQLFYKNLYRIGGHKMQEVLEKPLWYFKKWGFLAVDPPLLKDTRVQKRTYLYDSLGRLEILKNLARERKTFCLRDYLQKIGNSISRQQALKDFASISWIKKKGNGKGMVYYR